MADPATVSIPGGGRLWIRTLLGLCAGLATAAGVMAYLGISRRDLAAQVQALDGRPLLAAAAGALILLALQSLRWWLVMRPVLALRYGQAYRAMAVGFLFNTLLPARGGDLLRVQYLGRRTGISRARILGTEIVDFWSDKWGWIASFPVVCLLGDPPTWLYRVLLLLGGAVVGVGAVLALMGSGIWRSGPGGEPRGPRWLANFREGFAVHRWKRLLAIETLVAPLPWLWETFVIMVAGRAFGIELTVMQAFSVLTAFNAATMVPSPGNAGSFEAGGTLALTAFGVPQGTALTFIFLYHLTQVLPTVAFGVLTLIAEGETIFGKKSLFRLPPGGVATEVLPSPSAGPDPGRL